MRLRRPDVFALCEAVNGDHADGAVLLDKVLKMLEETSPALKDHYTVEEAAQMLGKAEYTVRQWCLDKRIRAKKKKSGRGKHQAWVIERDELERYQREGLLPEGKPDHVPLRRR